MKRLWLTLLASWLFWTATAWGQKRAVTRADYDRFRFIHEAVLSPDDAWIAYSLTRFNADSTRKNRDIYIVPTSGGTATRMTTHPADDWNPCWSPDSRLISFLSNRSGSAQVHVISMMGGEAQRISHLPQTIHTLKWSPDGRFLALAVTHDAGDSLFPGQTRLFMLDVEKNSGRDALPGIAESLPLLSPSHPTVAFSTDSRHIAFARTLTDPAQVDLFTVPVRGGTIRRISNHPGHDTHPAFSPDGKMIAYLSTGKETMGHSQYDIYIYNRLSLQQRNMSSEFDLNILEFCWDPFSKFILFTAEDQGRITLFSLDLNNGRIKNLQLAGCNSCPAISSDANHIFYLQSQIHRPYDIFRCDWTGENEMQLTFSNHDLLQGIEMNPVRDFWFQGNDNRIIHCMSLKPPFFDPAKTYPAVVLFRREPHGAWRDEFLNPWAPQLFAARGAVVLLINYRGARGYGDKFCQGTLENWGGTPVKDILAGVAAALKKYHYIDGNRLAAFGTLYGGYLAFWLAGHENPFQCLTSHAGISDPVSLYGTTGHSNWVDTEFGGSPYENGRGYDKWSPLKYAKHFHTPLQILYEPGDTLVRPHQALQMKAAYQFFQKPVQIHALAPISGVAAAGTWDLIHQWISQWTGSSN